MRKERFKRFGIALVVIFIGIQFLRPERNLGADIPTDIVKIDSVPANVEEILRISCYDCHSNHTVYPWYTNIQPVGWWMQHHVNEGKEHLNFSDFTTYPIAIQYNKLEGIAKLVNENDMPLPSYTWIHKNAILNDAQKKTITDWTNQVCNTIKANYPADSLVMPKRGKRKD